MSKNSVIKFQAQISGIRTTIDGGSNVTFALSGKEIDALTQLLQVRQQVGVMLEVVAVPVFTKEKLTNIDKQSEKKEPKTRDIRRAKQIT